MNFITFPVAATNIFPAANATSGGQLATEWNIRSRETVGTDPAITYQIGPSYTHGVNDFEVTTLKDSGGALINSYSLAIAEGRAVINGHYVETLTPMKIDLLEANVQLASQSRPILTGRLAIGIRSFYSTDQTVAGTILVENEDDMYLGIQLVVLPENELITPSESPTDQSKVTADLKLATFNFLNNNISDIVNLDSKISYLPADRIANLDSTVISSKYVTKIGLNSKKLYSFAGKGHDPETGADTWEDTTDSLVVWDKNYPQRISATPPLLNEATIITSSDSIYRYIYDKRISEDPNAKLSEALFVLPHKQVEGMTDDDGTTPLYYDYRLMNLPVAKYSDNTVGFVNKEYTKQIKAIATEVSEFRSSLHGKQIYYMETFEVDDELPAINPLWEIGDYILVGSDVHYLGAESDTTTEPSTMYVVLPGQVLEIGFIAQVEGDVNNDAEIPSNIDGVQLAFQDWYEASGQSRPDTEHPEYFPTFFSPSDTMLGIPKNGNRWNDYFKIRYYLENSSTYAYVDYYYGVTKSGPRQWSNAIIVTGVVGLATENSIGGFYNTSEDATDYGYVRLDDSGHLVLTDYALLRSGTLAYQIGQNLTIPTSDDPTEIQSYLTEYVNDRVAFPTTTAHGEYSPVIHIWLTLPETSQSATLELCGIDSRFNTAVCLHIRGNASSNITLNISDCEKLIIYNDIKGTPVINVFRCCLYYDPIVMQYIRTCSRDSSLGDNFTGFQDITLWYEDLDPYDDNLMPENRNILVDGMKITELDSQIISTEINYWKELGSAINDNHYLVALKSITFSGSGDIIGCEVLVANNSTDNVLPGDKIIVGEIALPQGSSLIYPLSCLTRVLKVSGEFTSAYYSDGNWYVTNNSFSFATGTYTDLLTQSSMNGTIAFHSTTSLVPSTISQTSINVWEPYSYHVFGGGVVT